MNYEYKLTKLECEAFDGELVFIVKQSYGMSANAIWCQINFEMPFLKRKSAFLYILGRLIEDGTVKIGRAHILMDGGKEEICKRFDLAWPSENVFDDDEFITVLPYKCSNDQDWRTHYWTPGDIVWIDDAGAELWSTDAEQ